MAYDGGNFGKIDNRAYATDNPESTALDHKSRNNQMWAVKNGEQCAFGEAIDTDASHKLFSFYKTAAYTIPYVLNKHTTELELSGIIQTGTDHELAGKGAYVSVWVKTPTTMHKTNEIDFSTGGAAQPFSIKLDGLDVTEKTACVVYVVVRTSAGASNVEQVAIPSGGIYSSIKPANGTSLAAKIAPDDVFLAHSATTDNDDVEPFLTYGGDSTKGYDGVLGPNLRGSRISAFNAKTSELYLQTTYDRRKLSWVRLDSIELRQTAPTPDFYTARQLRPYITPRYDRGAGQHVRNARQWANREHHRVICAPRDLKPDATTWRHFPRWNIVDEASSVEIPLVLFADRDPCKFTLRAAVVPVHFGGTRSRFGDLGSLSEGSRQGTVNFRIDVNGSLGGAGTANVNRDIEFWPVDHTGKFPILTQLHTAKNHDSAGNGRAHTFREGQLYAEDDASDLVLVQHASVSVDLSGFNSLEPVYTKFTIGMPRSLTGGGTSFRLALVGLSVAETWLGT